MYVLDLNPGCIIATVDNFYQVFLGGAEWSCGTVFGDQIHTAFGSVGLFQLGAVLSILAGIPD